VKGETKATAKRVQTKSKSGSIKIQPTVNVPNNSRINELRLTSIEFAAILTGALTSPKLSKRAILIRRR
jgi:hypothetical protein